MSKFKSNFTINFIELKYRLIYLLYSSIFIFIICFFFRVELFFLISNLFLELENGFIYTSLLDPIIIYFKLSFLYSFIILCPLVFYFIGFFFIKSLYSFQLRFFSLYFFSLYIVTFSLFIFISKYFLQIILHFLVGFQRLDTSILLELKLQATITQYYNFFFSYLFFYMLLVLIPNVFLFFVLTGVISNFVFLEHRYRKYIYLAIFGIFLIIAPPDLFLQLFLTPFIILFLEVFIFMITFFYKLYLHCN